MSEPIHKAPKPTCGHIKCIAEWERWNNVNVPPTHIVPTPLDTPAPNQVTEGGIVQTPPEWGKLQ